MPFSQRVGNPFAAALGTVRVPASKFLKQNIYHEQLGHLGRHTAQLERTLIGSALKHYIPQRGPG